MRLAVFGRRFVFMALGILDVLSRKTQKRLLCYYYGGEKMAGKRAYTYRVTALALALAMLAGLLPTAALKAWAVKGDPIRITEQGATGDNVQTAWLVRADDTVWDENDPVCGGWYVVAGSVVNTNRIEVKGDVTLYLTTSSSLTVTQGIQVSEGNSLTIRSENNCDSGKLIAGQMQGKTCCDYMAECCTYYGDCYTSAGGKCCGSLGFCGTENADEQEKMRLYKAEIEDGRAGIGGDASAPNAGTITIYGGTVTAQGGTAAAGIGGGPGGDGGNITIYGGIVSAQSGEPVYADHEGHAGAAIGGGNGGKAGTIEINGGIVTASGLSNDAGIGGGSKANGGSITINGGTIKATGGPGGAGIGGGSYSAVDKIEINGGNVTATSLLYAAGIGGGMFSTGGTVVINGGTVNASGQGDGTGIGGGLFAASGNITINGGEVTANGGKGGAGIGNGVGCSSIGDNDRVLIAGGTVTATGGKEDETLNTGAGIGGGRGAVGAAVYITGGEVTATGGADKYGVVGAPGIGGGINSGNDGTFATNYEGVTGDATITASSIAATTDKDQWSGVINGERYEAKSTSVVLSGNTRIGATSSQTGTQTETQGQTETPETETTITGAGTGTATVQADASDDSGTALLLAAGAAGAAGVAGAIGWLYSTGKLGVQAVAATLEKAGAALQGAAPAA
jgi:hypothetical protein